MKAAVTRERGAGFSIEDVRLSGPGPDEVLVRMVATGVCHTDAVGRDAAVSPYPIVLGHEGSGIVERVGDNVTRLAPGDHAVMSFAHCGQCANCLTGHPRCATSSTTSTSAAGWRTAPPACTRGTPTWPPSSASPRSVPTRWPTSATW